MEVAARGSPQRHPPYPQCWGFGGGPLCVPPPPAARAPPGNSKIKSSLYVQGRGEQKRSPKNNIHHQQQRHATSTAGAGGAGPGPPLPATAGRHPQAEMGREGGSGHGSAPPAPAWAGSGVGGWGWFPPPFCFFFCHFGGFGGFFVWVFFCLFVFCKHRHWRGGAGGGQACGRVLRGRSSGCRLGSHRRLRQAGTRTATVSSSFTAAGRPGPPSRGSGRSATCRRGGATRGSPRTGWCEAGPGRRCTA